MRFEGQVKAVITQPRRSNATTKAQRAQQYLQAGRLEEARRILDDPSEADEDTGDIVSVQVNGENAGLSFLVSAEHAPRIGDVYYIDVTKKPALGTKVEELDLDQ